jgi:hypothetical protein
MRILEIDVPVSAELARIDDLVGACATRLGLRIAQVGTLASYRGSRHWHLKRNRTGTIELTVWPERRRAWLSVHENRDGGWATGMMDDLACAIGQELF